ncbi:hypothetical protein COT72_01070 [archaeon CG10_big_fil_rev_8_21_14_0_10_43_11]|nr:MAG: hypothetical protein COT72_01070 [archaeon CG10_big_fil_rev_8_21_14_0_10_43_11]
MGIIIGGLSFFIGLLLLTILILLLLVQAIGAQKPGALLVVLLLVSSAVLLVYAGVRAQTSEEQSVTFNFPFNMSITLPLLERESVANETNVSLEQNGTQENTTLPQS